MPHSSNSNITDLKIQWNEFLDKFKISAENQVLLSLQTKLVYCSPLWATAATDLNSWTFVSGAVVPGRHREQPDLAWELTGAVLLCWIMISCRISNKRRKAADIKESAALLETVVWRQPYRVYLLIHAHALDGTVLFLWMWDTLNVDTVVMATVSIHYSIFKKKADRTMTL